MYGQPPNGPPGYGPPPGPQGQGYGPAPSQQSYGPPPQQHPSQGQYGLAPQQGYAPQTVMGAPLEPGERVLWFRKHDYTTEKIVLIVFGVLFLIFLVGIIFLVMAFTLEGRSPRAHVVTNRRLLVFGPGNVPPTSYPLQFIADLTAERRRNRGGGGLIGLAVGAAVTAAMNYSANTSHKLTPSYWSRTEAIVIAFSNGQRAVVKCATSYGPALGLLLTRASLNREADVLPPAQNYLP